MALERLRAVIDGVPPARRERVRHALVAFAIRQLEERLPPPEKDDGHRGCLDEARRWLVNPTAEVESELSVWITAECWDGGARYFDYPDFFLIPADMASSSLPSALDSLAKLQDKLAAPAGAEDAMIEAIQRAR